MSRYSGKTLNQNDAVRISRTAVMMIAFDKHSYTGFEKTHQGLYNFLFVRIAAESPYYATWEEIRFFLDLGREKVVQLLERHHQEINREHERADTWTFSTRRLK